MTLFSASCSLKPRASIASLIVIASMAFAFSSGVTSPAHAGLLDIKKMFDRCTPAMEHVMERRVYLAFDTNGTRIIEQDELSALVQSYYSAFDYDRDQKLNANEFKDAQDFIILNTLKGTFALLDPNLDSRAPIGKGREDIDFERDLRSRGPEEERIFARPCEELFKWIRRGRALGLVNAKTYHDSLKDLDLNRDNVATLEEYIRVNKEDYQKNKTRRFEVFDSNNDKLISAQEFAAQIIKKL